MRISPPYLEALDAEHRPHLLSDLLSSRRALGFTSLPAAHSAITRRCNPAVLRDRRLDTAPTPYLNPGEPWCLQAGGCAACRSARTSATPPPHASRRGARAPPLPRRRCRVGGAHVRGHVLRHVQDTSDRRCWRGGSKRRRRRRGARGAATTRHVRDMSATRPRYAPAGACCVVGLLHRRMKSGGGIVDES